MKPSTLQLFNLSTLAAALAVATARAAVPVIDTSSVKVEQKADRTVVIEYTMNPATAGDTELAIVTADILTNGVSVGGEHLTTLSGDVNKTVAHTQDYRHYILWEPKNEGFPEFSLPAAQVTAQLTLWATNSPPAYWVIDLTHPADRSYDRYYPNAGQIPGTVTNDLYKTDRLVFRRIPAKGVTWKMGSTETYGNSTYHYVTFSYDYWMAIYETTQKQNELLQARSSTQSLQSATPIGDAFPYTGNNYRTLRQPNAYDGGYTKAWPVGGHTNCTGGAIFRYREGLNGLLVDLPTEAEWEFACRAGSADKYCNGNTESDLAKVAWYKGNAGDTWREVGTKEPNAFGLYDMHGNVAEQCLDWWSFRTADPVWNPAGASYDSVTNLNYASTQGYKWQHPRFGGYFNSTADNCSSSSIAQGSRDNAAISSTSGHRLCIVIP